MVETEKISLEQMRELLPPGETYTDKFLIELRSQLYDLANLALDCYFESKKPKLPLQEIAPPT